MLAQMLIVAKLVLLYVIHSDEHCIDIHSQVVSQGLHYVPGPNPCTLCICDRGSAKWCKSVLCSPPQNCKSFQVGNSCCEFKCLDDILTTSDGYKETYDLALRLAASAVTAVLSLSLLFFLLHRLKRRKVQIRQNHQMNDDQRSLNSIGYIPGSLGYLAGNIGYLSSGNNELEFHYEESTPHYSLWKPRGNCCPRDEAPPPYEEAVRTARTENNTINNQIRTITNLSLSNMNISSEYGNNRANSQLQSTMSIPHCRHEYNVNSFPNNLEYANISVPNVTVYQNDRNGKDVDFNQSINSKSCKREQSKSFENVLPHTRYDGVVKMEKCDLDWSKERPHKLDTQPKCSFKRKMDKLKVHEACRYLCKEKNCSHENTKHRTIPNSLNNVLFRESDSDKECVQMMHRPPLVERPEKRCRRVANSTVHRTMPKNASLQARETDPLMHRSLPKQATVNLIKSHLNIMECNSTARKANDGIMSSASCTSTSEIASRSNCNYYDECTFVSYQCLSSQDEEDYRSECENCKSLDFSNMENEEVDILNETMTLQRRPLEQDEEPLYYRTSLTLPINTKRPRTTSTNSVRESWFIAMQETSSEESE